MQGSGLALVCPSQIPEGCRMSLGLGVVGDQELEMEKSSVGSVKAGYFSLTIIYLVSMFFYLIYL